MGGIVIVLSTIIVFSILNFTRLHLDIRMYFLLIMPIVMYASIGLIDDYLIVIKKSNNGLSSRFKFFLQIIWAGMYFFLFLDHGFSSEVNFFGKMINFKWFYGVLILFMLVASSNAVNLSDGLDGLATGLSIILLIFISFFAYNYKNNEVLYFSLSLIGALIAFLCFNYHPAKLFMGDTGSLALGATFANLFILLKLEILLPIVGIVFVLETISVIIQVVYFKATKGKRVFLMTPLHHHYELKGLRELEVDYLFWIIGIIGGIIGFLLFPLF